MKSVNPVVIPEYSREMVLASVKKAQEEREEKVAAEKGVALDFYYHDNVDTHIEEYFPSEALSQIPTFPQKVVPRFARARMMLYKQPPRRFIRGEESEDYRLFAHSLNSKTRQFAELAWLLGECAFRSKWNEPKQRLEYDIIPHFKRYFVEGESDPVGISYEIGKSKSGDRQFVFWSEAREGQEGLHFRFTQGGKIVPVNEDLVNPYQVLPVTTVELSASASDVVRAAIQMGIAMTEIALGVRYALGKPILSGVEERTQLKGGIENALVLPEGATFNYVSPTGNLTEMIDAAKAMMNMAAENNHLRIRWGESGGNPPSGESLRILEIENLEARESDEQIFREWENARYSADRAVVLVHQGKDFGEDYSVDFAEAEFPLSQKEELEVLKMKKEMGIMTQREIIRHFNPDISDEELDEKAGEIAEEQTVRTGLEGIFA